MTRPTLKGTCSLCGGTFSKQTMTRHLASCRERQAAPRSGSGRTSQNAKIFHLVVEGRYLPEYWMHIEAPATATLAHLDRFLRDTWLECCGHLSAFKIGGKGYISHLDPYDNWSRDRSMRIALGKVLGSGMKFSYEYDFGTTTELALKVVAEREDEVRGKGITVLARNLPPPLICDSCGQPATLVCTICAWSEGGWLCDQCAPDHECEDEMFLPVVNSPRVGMCGYTG